MNKLININESIKIAKKMRKQNKKIVVAGGFFDIMHTGHIKFLENAKRSGDYLFALLEDDNKARKIKGPKRPINSQKNRAIVLSSLQSVDYVVLLKNMTSDIQYDKLISQMAPSIIATTYGDSHINHKKRQAKLVNGKIAYVIARMTDYSTSKLAKNL